MAIDDGDARRRSTRSTRQWQQRLADRVGRDPPARERRPAAAGARVPARLLEGLRRGRGGSCTSRASSRPRTRACSRPGPTPRARTRSTTCSRRSRRTSSTTRSRRSPSSTSSSADRRRPCSIAIGALRPADDGRPPPDDGGVSRGAARLGRSTCSRTQRAVAARRRYRRSRSRGTPAATLGSRADRRSGRRKGRADDPLRRRRRPRRRRSRPSSSSFETATDINYMCSMPNVQRLSTSFQSAGAAGLNYFDTLLVEPFAAEREAQRRRRARTRVAILEPDYLVALMADEAAARRGPPEGAQARRGARTRCRGASCSLAGSELAYFHVGGADREVLLARRQTLRRRRPDDRDRAREGVHATCSRAPSATRARTRAPRRSRPARFRSRQSSPTSSRRVQRGRRPRRQARRARRSSGLVGVLADRQSCSRAISRARDRCEA